MVQTIDKTLLHSILLPLVLNNGNTGRSKRWFSSSNSRRNIETLIRATGNVRDRNIGPFQFPVTLRITRILGKAQKAWDSDSIGRGNAKELIDSLVSCGWLVDDSPKYVTQTIYEQETPSERLLVSSTRVEFFRS